MKGNQTGLLTTLASPALVAGGVGSVALTLIAGRRNPSVVLIALFVGWVASPFVGLALARRVSHRWPPLARTTLHSLIPVISLLSVFVYLSTVMNPPASRGAAPFLLVPLASWLLMGVSMLAARLRSSRPRD